MSAFRPDKEQGRTGPAADVADAKVPGAAEADLASNMSGLRVDGAVQDGQDGSTNQSSGEKRKALRRQESTHREEVLADDSASLKQRTKDHNLQEAKDLGNGNTTSLVGGLSLTGADATSQDRKKFFHRSCSAGEEVRADDHDKFAVFVEWLQKNGAHMPGLYLKKYTDDVRGVHASSQLHSQEQIVTIPERLLIHEGMGQKTSVGRRVHQDPSCHVIVPAHTQVIIYILEHLNDNDNFFKPYFDILPRTFKSFPIFWTEEELSWLEGSDLLRQIQDRKINIKADYDSVCRCCPDFAERHNLEDFLWCRTAVGSRNFGITINGVKRTTMVPFADMLNHYRPRETSWTFDDSQQSFTMTSLVDISIGQQVMDSYGKKCNSKFLLHYGFAIERNREEDGRCQNEVFMKFHMPEAGTDPHHAQRLQLAGPTLSIRVMMTFDEKRTQEAFSYNRLLVANEEELKEIQRTHRSAYSLTSNPIHPISPRNEIATLLSMAEVARKQLAKYPTSYADDLEMLASDKLTPFSNRRHAYIVIASEKEILTWFVSLAEECIPILKCPIDEAIQLVNERYTGTKSDTARYLRSTVYSLRNKSRW